MVLGLYAVLMFLVPQQSFEAKSTQTIRRTHMTVCMTATTETKTDNQEGKSVRVTEQ